MFYNEVDEGLWFYLPGIRLVSVPGSNPRYNTAYDLAENYRRERLTSETASDLEATRIARDRQLLIDWLDYRPGDPSYLLIRSRTYDRYADELADRVTPVFRETGLKRNGLTLLRVGAPPRAITATVVPIQR
jgi:hypothetical protein